MNGKLLNIGEAAQASGISAKMIRQIAELLGLWRDKHRPSSKVKQLTEQHIDALEQKILALHAMKAQLQQLAKACHGDARPDCPILDKFASGE